MTTVSRRISDRPRSDRSASRRPFRTFLLLLLTIPFWVGCDGCRQSGPDADADKDKTKGKEAPPEEFTFGSAAPLPGGNSAALTAIKPGHWFSLRQSVRSNVADQRGDLKFQCFARETQNASSTSTSATFLSERPAVLPKGRMKRLDVRMLASHTLLGNTARISTSGIFSSPTTTTPSQRMDHIPMRAVEYYFAILTKRPERFVSFQASDWVRPPQADEDSPSGSPNYRIVFPRASGLLALPETMLDWTSTAVLFWDDVSPSEMTSEQRRALTDWLHFGGRLVINGDSAVTELANSELASLLPIRVDGMTDLDPEAAAALVENWSVNGDDSEVTVGSLVRSLNSRVAIDGALAQGAVPVEGTSELIATRRVGRGEIVMSRFDLTSDWLTGWRSTDSFINAAVLARPARRYTLDQGSLKQSYAPEGTTDQMSLAMIGGALINTSLRLASRDAVPNVIKTLVGDRSNITPETQREMELISTEGFAASPVSGIGGWRDDSGTALYLQSMLRERSGVSIPPLPFVLKSLSIYLVILVPLNYLAFWLLGRLEWAWVAVPMLALLGAGWIAKTVSLDLGLAKNRTEVAFIELQPNYSRGHVTRFVSLYNSLSGTYSIQFETPDVAAAPVGIFNTPETDVEKTVFRYGYDSGPSLMNFAVPSNRTRVFHAEQMVDFDGAIQWEADSLRNGTSLTLKDVMLVRHSTANGANGSAVEIAMLDVIEPGMKLKPNWSDVTSAKIKNPLLEPFLDPLRLRAGEMKMVAMCDDPMPGMNVTPEMPQQAATTIVLAHLSHTDVLRSKGDLSLMPRKQEREKMLLDQDTNVQEEVVP